MWKGSISLPLALAGVGVPGLYQGGLVPGQGLSCWIHIISHCLLTFSLLLNASTVNDCRDLMGLFLWGFGGCPWLLQGLADVAFCLVLP